jgi:EAL and modified HD-GYP domain-containing signal transduction protein
MELPLRPETTVLEVLETVHSDPEVLAGIAYFRRAGFRIALDDYVSEHHDEGLLAIADIVKIDLLAEPVERLRHTAAKLLDRGLIVVAEKVEAREQFEQCRSLGIHSFQGFWFQRPETFTAQGVSPDRLATLHVLAALQDVEISVAKLERVVSKDLALVYRLLRVINSGYYNLPRPVTTVHEALRMLGLDNVRRLCSLTALAAFDNRPQELMVSALVRARMCELLALISHPAQSAMSFLAGLLSHLDALLGVPTAEAVGKLPLTKELQQALTHRAGWIGATLKSVIDFERGQWEGSGTSGVSAEHSQALYLDAVRWADEAQMALRA